MTREPRTGPSRSKSSRILRTVASSRPKAVRVTLRSSWRGSSAASATTVHVGLVMSMPSRTMQSSREMEAERWTLMPS